MKRGCLITLEGGEGVGKSTCLEYVRRFLEKRGISVVATREPGGIPLAEGLRDLILNFRPLEPEAELLLIFAARIQHVRELILPSLKMGKWVVIDRFIDASYAYQGGGRELPESRIRCLEQWLMGDCTPDLTLLLDAPVKVGLARVRARGITNRFEEETPVFMERVRRAYLARWRKEPDRIHRIDATCSLARVQREIAARLEFLLNTWKD